MFPKLTLKNGLGAKIYIVLFYIRKKVFSVFFQTSVTIKELCHDSIPRCKGKKAIPLLNKSSNNGYFASGSFIFM